jgi:hypothetical protein
MVETTVNLAAGTRAALERASGLTGRAKSRLVADAMKRLMRGYGELVRDGRSVEYQERRGVLEWRRLHVSIEYRDYEFFIDMRKLCRRSVSFLVACAVDKYLDDIIEMLMGNGNSEESDNYPFLHYIIMHSVVPGAVCWTIYWGMPENPEILFPMTPPGA